MWHRRAILLALALALALPWPGRPAAAQPSPPGPLDEVMRGLAAVRESRARFVEDRTVAALARPVRSEGWLLYRRPAHLEKTTTGPVAESLMVDGDRLSIVADGRQPAVIDLGAEPAIAGLVAAIRGTLAGDLAALRASYAVAMQGDPGAWRLTLTPTDPALAGLLRQVTVDGSGAALRRVRTVQANGDESVMTITPGA